MQTQYAELTARNGRPCPIWRNPTEFASGLRGLLTQSDLYVWESVDLLHADFERLTGIEGMRIVLRAGEVHADNETVALPEHFPWVLADTEALDVDERRRIVMEHLHSRLQHIYPTGFTVFWYQ